MLHAGQRIASIEKDFAPVKAAMESSELLLFSYPVYTFIAPCQLHRIIELMKQHGVRTEGKFATQITTSKHFYDVTAHRYIQDNCQEMGMRYIRGLSADMDDLLCERGRREACAFFERVVYDAAHGYAEPVRLIEQAYFPEAAHVPAQTGEEKPGDVVIVTDLADGDTQLAAMIDRFRAVLPLRTRMVNLREFPFRGGCLGCFNCAADGVCVYKDGFDAYLRETIQSGQAIIYAFTIRDHSMGARFKMYDDRQFCNGHRTVTMGMPMGYLISGCLNAEINLQTIIEARAQVGGNMLCGAATDERDTDAQIDHLADSLVYALERRYAQPQNFYGVGGMKIFRDLIYQMQGMMKADHKFYKAHGQYDFPQKNKGLVLKMYLVGLLLSNRRIRSKMGNAMNEGMIAPYKKVIESAGGK